ncbi:hypothetical protein [Lactiplantibacillus plantarum]|jgi:hypothetical protein|uniref:hypothetical protein n=1 Tax=Lactiplantibacillus plantarum TaxID=1590 RepID=UPI001E612D6F|nr:hypothetical protein [Lactiplantibacillus plantarum]
MKNRLKTNEVPNQCYGLRNLSVGKVYPHLSAGVAGAGLLKKVLFSVNSPG